MLCEILESISTRQGTLHPGTIADIPEEVFLKLTGKVRMVEQPTAKPFTELACGSCLYFGWEGLNHYCRHLNNNRIIAGVDCGGRYYVDRYKKRSPNKKKDWLEPVTMH